MRNRAGLVLAVAVGVLVLLAVVAGVLSATRGGPELPEGSPEATVQDYLRAVHDRDPDAAVAHLDPEGDCSAEDLQDHLRNDTARAVLRSSQTTGDTAVVQIDLVYGGGPFGSDEFRDQQRFELRRAGDGWVITGEPWPMFLCRNEAP